MAGHNLTAVTTAARVAVAVDDWRDAVREACDPLVAAGAFEASYADASIANIEQHGPYMVVAPGVAFIHARPEDGVQELALGAIVLRTPVAFGHDLNDPVDLVFAFGSPDRDQHVGLLAALSRRLLSGLAGQLRKSSSDEDAANLLRSVINDVE